MNVDFGVLVGERLTRVDNGVVGTEEITFRTESGRTFKMYHVQDCCENVWLEDIVGNDLEDLIGYEILRAEEVGVDREGLDDSYTWTYYIIETNKHIVSLRWYGTSNGYYSEEVDFIEIT